MADSFCLLPDEICAAIIRKVDYRTLVTSLCLVSKKFYDLAVTYGGKEDVDIKIITNDVPRRISCYAPKTNRRFHRGLHQITLKKFEEYASGLAVFTTISMLEWKMMLQRRTHDISAKQLTQDFCLEDLYRVFKDHNLLERIRRIKVNGSVETPEEVAEFDDVLSKFAKPGTLIDSKEYAGIAIPEFLRVVRERNVVIKRLKEISIPQNQLVALLNALTDDCGRLFDDQVVVKVSVENARNADLSAVFNSFLAKLVAFNRFIIKKFELSGVDLPEMNFDRDHAGNDPEFIYRVRTSPWGSCTIKKEKKERDLLIF